MKLRQIFLRAVPAAILVLIALFAYLEYRFRQEEETYQGRRQVGWALHLPHQEDTSYVSCGHGSILIDREDRVWVAGQCAQEGIYVFDGKEWKSQTSGLHDKTFNHLGIDALGQIWTVDNNAAVYFDGTQWQTAIELDRCEEGRMDFLDADGEGRIWILIYNGCTSGANLERSQVRMFEDGVWTTFTPGNSALPNDPLRSIDFDADGTAIIDTPHGEFKLEDGSWTQTAERENTDITDPTGRVWTWDSDSIRVRDSDWVTLTVANSGLAGPRIYDLAIDSSGHVWIGNQEGVSEFLGGEIDPLPSQVIAQREQRLEWEQNLNGYNWFLPSTLVLVWLAAYLNVLAGALVPLGIGLLATVWVGPYVYGPYGYTEFINPGAIATYAGMLGGILGGLLDQMKDKPRRFGWTFWLAALGLLIGFLGVAFILVLFSS